MSAYVHAYVHAPYRSGCDDDVHGLTLKLQLCCFPHDDMGHVTDVHMCVCLQKSVLEAG